MNGRLTGHGSLSGGLTGGIGGVSDYEALENLPIMNDKTIEGNHNGHYYGLANLSDIPEPYTPPNYSTNEVNTGVKWIDGKDIYRIVISFNEIYNGMRLTIPQHTYNEIIKLHGIVSHYVDGSMTETVDIPFYFTSQYYIRVYFEHDNDGYYLLIETNSTTSEYYNIGFVIFEFTKVTE